MAMVKVLNDLLTSVDSGRPSVLLSLDSSAAFDALNHNCLLQHATEFFGFSVHVHEWLRSYLSGRSSYIALGECLSTVVDCTTGVPQGSVLGPLLFAIFTIPVGRLISKFGVSYHQYADDMQLYMALDLSMSVNLTRLSDCINAVACWHYENGLQLNPSKTEALITGTRQQVARFNFTSTLRVAEAMVPYSKTIRILWVTLDPHQTFDEHVTNIVRSCNYHTRSLRHIRPLIDKDTTNTLACSIVASRLEYYNALLVGVTERNLQCLQPVQNSLARAICHAPFRSPSALLLQSLHWLPIKRRIDYKIATLVFKTVSLQNTS
jgi:hypothetical protein